MYGKALFVADAALHPPCVPGRVSSFILMRPFGSRAEMRIGAPDARAATCVRGLREWMAGMLKASRSSVGGVEGHLAMPAGDSDTSACLSPIGVSGACLRKGLSACTARRGLRLRSDCSTLLQRYSPCTKLAMEWHSESIRATQSHSAITCTKLAMGVVQRCPKVLATTRDRLELVESRDKD